MDIYESTAIRCRSYEPDEGNTFVNYTGHKSCESCNNFDEDKHCKLDLYDKLNDTE